ncbi:phosphatase PAP2 family protein [Streptomyces polyrhachis]|uniref:Phosphatase PAP2 family protein n=1 Tax=Streptomyces polyrhachis TaxID=1282885 RepID=A0ABW2GP11_9ACTN
MATTAVQRLQRWWAELLLIVVVYVAYSAGRLLARGAESQAVDNGLAILDFEKAFRLNAEHPLNDLFTAHAWIGVPADFVYATLHYLVTPAVLVWLWARRREHYRRLRTWLLGSTVVGLVGFVLLPTCPPRLLEPTYGFVDTMAQYASYGWWGGEASAPRGLGGFTNQYAAMPSLHVGWALWCGIVLFRHARTPLVRALAVAYPLLITVVVMGTANHYLLDAVAGVAVMGAGWLLSKPLMRASELTFGRLRAALARDAVPAAEPAADSADGADGASERDDERVLAPASAVDGAPVVSGGWKTAARGPHIPRQRDTAPAVDPSGNGADSPASAAGDAPVEGAQRASR